MDLRAAHDTLLLFALLAVGVTCALVLLLYRRTKHNAGHASQNPLHDMTEIAILFQTMRDLVREQKTVARDFNRSLDAKVEVVREAVRQVIAAHEHLTRMQNALRAQLQKSGVVLEDLGFDEDDLPPLQAIAMPEDADLLDSWQADDADDEDESTAEVEAESAPAAVESEHDSVEAHEAIGELLNFNENPESQPDETQDAKQPPPANGTTSVRKTVFRYHDAGMNVSEIANELGLGKGEIRLMLNLREEERSSQTPEKTDPPGASVGKS